MAEIDFTFLDGSADAGAMRRGVSSAFARPNGGLNFVFGFHSQQAGAQAIGMWYNRANFNPLVTALGAATGGSITFAVQKRLGSANTNYTPFGFICLRNGTGAAPAPSVDDVGYLLGLDNNSPYVIGLYKGAPSAGLPAASGSPSSLLRAGSVSTLPGQWHHLRLDAIVNPNGDVILRCFQNDLTANTVTSPVWTAIPGITDFTDDALGVLSGSPPLSGGFAGLGMWSQATSRLGLFDHFTLARQP